MRERSLCKADFNFVNFPFVCGLADASECRHTVETDSAGWQFVTSDHNDTNNIDDNNADTNIALLIPIPRPGP